MTYLLKRLLEGDRQALAKAITLVESSREDHQKEANDLLEKVLAKKKKFFKFNQTNFIFKIFNK